MITIHESIAIEDSPEAVFAFACDYANDLLRRSGVAEIRFVTELKKGKGAMARGAQP